MSESSKESVTFQLRLPSGARAICSTSYGFHEARRYHMFGSDGWAQLDPGFAHHSLRMMMLRKSPINSMAENIAEVRLPEKNQFALEIDGLDTTCGPAPRMLR